MTLTRLSNWEEDGGCMLPICTRSRDWGAFQYHSESLLVGNVGHYQRDWLESCMMCVPVSLVPLLLWRRWWIIVQQYLRFRVCRTREAYFICGGNWCIIIVATVVSKCVSLYLRQVTQIMCTKNYLLLTALFYRIRSYQYFKWTRSQFFVSLNTRSESLRLPVSQELPAAVPTL